MNHINFRHSLLPVLFGILLFSVSCSSGHKTGITWDKEFHVVQRTALEKNQNFCITLIDTTNRTSQIYLERLYEHTPDAIFNLVNAEPGIANWYSQWLYSISTPVTCIFTPEGKLIDIIPGASRKCFRCIKEVAENGKMTRNLAYYNNFSISKDSIIPLLNVLLQCKNGLEKEEDITGHLAQIPEDFPHPYACYLKLQNAMQIKNGFQTEAMAKELLSYEDWLSLELYPELFIKAKMALNPQYNPKQEAIMQSVSLIRLDKCPKGVPIPFQIELSNNGGRPLHVSGIEMSCSCLNYLEEDSFDITPYGRKSLHFEFIAEEEQRIEREILIKSNGIYPIKRIRIIANGQNNKRKEV